MMEEYPSNSREKSAPEKKPQQEKIVTGKVVQRKRPLGRRFLDTFSGGDARGALDFVIMEVLLPAAKDAIADATSQGVERIIFGEARSRSRRPSRYGTSSSSSNTGYTRYSSPSTNYRSSSEPEPRRPSYRSRSAHDFKEIIIPTRQEAEETLQRLDELCERYGSATVSDLYDLVGISGSYTDGKWGWLELKDPNITRVREGYLLDLPRPEPID